MLIAQYRYRHWLHWKIRNIWSECNFNVNRVLTDTKKCSNDVRKEYFTRYAYMCVCARVKNERDTFWESNSRHQDEINTKMSLIFQITSDLILWTRTSQIYLLFRLINDYCISYQRVNFSVIITDYTLTISSVCVSTMWTFPKNLRILEKCSKYFLTRNYFEICSTE